MRLLTVTTILCALGLLACSTTKETYVKNSHYSHNHIYSEEIQMSTATNAYDLIRYLRPHWLRGRGRKSIKFEQVSYPLVYVNGNRHGSVNSLSTISVEQIKEIQFFNSGEATIKFGLNHPSGAILITIL